MKKQLFVIVLLLASVLFLSACTKHKSPAADSVLIHARIYTLNSKEPWVQAMAIRDGKIIAVGSDKEIAAYQGPSTKVIDAKERLALPGFVDAHVHIMAPPSLITFL
jgi:predicted amidohydrolase YtcJ